MKQFITSGQLQELSVEQRIALENWCLDRGYTAHVIYHSRWNAVVPDVQLSIGQMIEFLGENFMAERYSDGEWFVHSKFLYPRLERGKATISLNETIYSSNELCDALWKAVKQKLWQESQNENKSTEK